VFTAGKRQVHVSQLQDKYWQFLTDRRVLQRAAHLVGSDSRNDFEDSYLERQIFSHYRDEIITDIIHSLNSGRYLPQPATPVSIPKSELSRRPGLQLPYRDRIVLQAILMIVAPLVDEQLSENVWSWRVKEELKGKTPIEIGKRGLFSESDIGDFPFLKRKTIRTYIEEFEPWYALWPQFDERTRVALVDEDYKYMLFSDIAGYFENISLPILRDLLFKLLPDAPNTINLLMAHLYAWCRPAYDGSSTQRGIPQGNAISSFLGNIFLKPVDDFFDFHLDKSRILYFRYMDDIRILAKTREEARQAALALEEQIRSCQLNLQTSKTKLVSADDAMKMITDRRLIKLDGLLPRYKERKLTRERLLIELQEVARDRGDSRDARSIRGTKPLDGLNLRVLRRWAATHYEAKSAVPVARVATEALHNPNYKVTRELLRIGRRFPNRRNIAQAVSRFICARRPSFEYHEAELLRALRHFHMLPEEIFEHAERNANGSEYDPYVRVQSVLLLLRRRGELDAADLLVSNCLKSPDSRVILAGVLAVALNGPQAVAGHLRRLAAHASHDVTKLVQYVRALRREHQPREALLQFVFGTPDTIAERVYTYAAFLRFISTGDAKGSRRLMEVVEPEIQNRYTNAELRRFLRFLKTKAEENLFFLAGHHERDGD
jgi:hypothetical protein